MSKASNGSGNGHDPGLGEATPLQDLLSFPCKVHIKAVGHHNTRFEALVHSLVGKFIAPEDLLATSTRESRAGKYLAVTLTINATTREQLDDIYRALSSCKEVLIAL